MTWPDAVTASLTGLAAAFAVARVAVWATTAWERRQVARRRREATQAGIAVRFRDGGGLVYGDDDDVRPADPQCSNRRVR